MGDGEAFAGVGGDEGVEVTGVFGGELEAGFAVGDDGE